MLDGFGEALDLAVDAGFEEADSGSCIFLIQIRLEENSKSKGYLQ